MKRHMNDIFKLKKSIFAKNPGTHFTLKISANRRFGTYAGGEDHRDLGGRLITAF